jgi:uridylate kinase
MSQPRCLNSKTIVLKIGGSFLLTEDGPDVALLREMSDTVHALVQEDYRYCTLQVTF